MQLDLGASSSDDVLRAFDGFGWDGAAEPAPTLTVSAPSGKRRIWVSAYREGGSLAFASECRLDGEDLHHPSLHPDEARKALELFMSGDVAALRALYARPEAPRTRAQIDKAYLARQSLLDGLIVALAGLVLGAGSVYLALAQDEVPLFFTVPMIAGSLIATYVGVRIIAAKTRGGGESNG